MRGEIQDFSESLRRRAWQLFRALVDRKIVEILPREPRTAFASAPAASAVPASVRRASGAKSTAPVSPATRIGCAPPDQAASMRRLRAGEGRSLTREVSLARISAATVMPKVYAGAKRARILK